MSIHIAIRHRTTYTYDRYINLGPQVIRLKPAPHSRTKILAYSLKISPQEHFINWQQDPFGNHLARVVFANKVKEFEVDVDLIADLVTINPFDFFLEDAAQTFPFQYESQLKQDLAPYLEVVESGEKLHELYKKSCAYHKDECINFLVHCNQLVNRTVQYSIRMEPGVQSCEETLTLKIGSCRDSAWLLVQLFRMHGLAARFVSGYSVQLKADQKSLDGPSGVSEDVTDLHAWTEVYLPGAGWVGLDATSGLFAGEGHIPLSCSPSPSSSAPISGLLEPCETVFNFENKVTRIYETPRVSKPYSDDDWESIRTLGNKLDDYFEESDLRLSMGGEPTFVSIDDMESAQWNIEADGKDKRKLGLDLALKLKEAFAPSGLLHLGQGKWYPGESLPRWQYMMYWRKDGLPLWKNPELFARPDISQNHTYLEAQRLIIKLATILQLDSANVRAAYEDEYYYLWEQAKLPINADPKSPKADSHPARTVLAELLNRKEGTPAGFVLPIAYNVTGDTWESCYWELKRKELFLIPGTSRIGYRLPLNTLKEESPNTKETIIEPSLLDDLGVLSDPTKTLKKATQKKKGYRPTISTALCVEIVNGTIHVFLPPLVDLEHFVSLIHYIEEAIQTEQLKVIIEGYQAPQDYRLQKLGVTPDPGVIEVNIHPAKTWDEILHNYQVLFKATQASRLGAEKFMLDGRHTGTGGGNHITLGGLTPADSPLLRRPDLLRSMINFWHNHPSLSYLFSSTFVGPTSQAPRVDEGRAGNVNELAIAFKELERVSNPSPWLVDRIFRNILIDLTGNTHRAEFCIDKLYSPDSHSGRLGILELRGFDMPPNERMCIIQLLLIRCLVARFWKTPYRQPLIHWGDDLHDKFLLHYYAKQDMKEVIAYLNADNIAFKFEWLDRFFEFRFPYIGEVQVLDMKMKLRHAIEPWNVLGEEMSSAGTARYVDSSVEKVELTIEGLQTDRYKVLCNLVALPLQYSSEEKLHVTGIRYKAWNPPSSLHPTIEPDAPLVFDIYDSWNQRSVGGCTYYVAHPGGRSYDTNPVNSLEAESRRVTRFVTEGHTPTPIRYENTSRGVVQNTFIPNSDHSNSNVPLSIIDFSETKKYTADLRKVKR